MIIDIIYIYLSNKDRVLLVVSMSTPRKVMRWLGPTTFSQLIKNPSFLKFH